MGLPRHNPLGGATTSKDMLKFIKHHMETIAGIELYPLISFSIFFIFFLLLLVYILKVDKRMVDNASRIPLDDKSSEL